MTYKIIILAIEALNQLAPPFFAMNNRPTEIDQTKFNRDVDDAIKALKKVKKYL